MFIGTTYFRPPNPRQKDWERDLERIARTGLSVVRTWMYWAVVNPRSGVWEWAAYDRFFDLAEKNGLKVLVQLMAEAPPEWFWVEHPETLPADEHGRRMVLEGVGGQAIGGFPGLCFHVPIARSGAEAYFRAAVERYRDRPNVFVWDLWNELWGPDCFCSETQRVYRQWLEEKYGEIGNLNARWQRRFGSLEQVVLHRLLPSGNYVEQFDQYLFRQWCLEASMEWRAKIVRSVDPHHPIVSHEGGWMILQPDRDQWRITRPLDQWGLSVYADVLPEMSESPSLHWLVMNATADSAQGKPWWVSETAGGRTWLGYGRHVKTPEEIRTSVLLPLAFGSSGSVFWQWRNEIFGTESPNFGLTDLNGNLTERTEALSEMVRMARDHPEVFDAPLKPDPEIGLVYDIFTHMYEATDAETKNLLWRNFVGIYHVLARLGYEVKILDAGQLAGDGVPEGIRLLIHPMGLFDHPGLAEKLSAWVQNGGTLLAGPFVGLYGEDTFVSDPYTLPWVAELFGVEYGEILAPAEAEVSILGDVAEGLGHGILAATGPIEAGIPRSARPWAVVNGDVVGTIRSVGSGRALWVGVAMGASSEKQVRGGAARVLDVIAGLAGASPNARATAGCVARAFSVSGRVVVILHNPHWEERTTWVTLSADLPGSVADLLAGERIAADEGGRSFPIRVAARDTRVLLSAR